MARIAGVDLPREKRLEVALTYIYGIGRSLSRKILTEAEVSADVRVKDLTEDQVNKLRRVIEGLLRAQAFDPAPRDADPPAPAHRQVGCDAVQPGPHVLYCN